MNARLYDPVHGLFLAPDPYISDPFDSRDYNRYGYALDNPLKYVDITGEEEENLPDIVLDPVRKEKENPFEEKERKIRIDEPGGGGSSTGPKPKKRRITDPKTARKVLPTIVVRSTKKKNKWWWEKNRRDAWTIMGYVNMGIGAIGAAAEAQGLRKQSLWQIANGWRANYTVPVSRWTTLGKTAGNVNTGLTAISLINDGIQISQNNLSLGRFSYHLAGFGASVYIGSQLGGPYGAAVGVGFGVMELGYDHVVAPYVVDPARETFNYSFNRWYRGIFRHILH